MQDLPSSQFFDQCQTFFCKYPRTLSEKRVWLPLGFWSAQPIRSEFTSVVVSIWTSFWRRDFLLGSSDFSGKTEPNRFVTSHTRPAVPSSLGCDLQSHLDEFPALHDWGILLSTGDGDIRRCHWHRQLSHGARSSHPSFVLKLWKTVYPRWGR